MGPCCPRALLIEVLSEFTLDSWSSGQHVILRPLGHARIGGTWTRDNFSPRPHTNHSTTAYPDSKNLQFLTFWIFVKSLKIAEATSESYVEALEWLQIIQKKKQEDHQENVLWQAKCTDQNGDWNYLTSRIYLFNMS